MGRLELFEGPVIGVEELESWGHVLCVAPHPDDESLGCGGTLGRLSSRGNQVGVVWVSDGAGSHPNSVRYAAPKLAQLREREARLAVQNLGIGEANLFFMGLPDGDLPFPDDCRFRGAIEAASGILATFRPDTLLLPWRRDPHRDHRAAWLMWAYASQSFPQVQTLEYLVWAFERAAQEEWPDTTEANAIRVDVADFQHQKRAAIDAHASQTTHLIDDDPSGFWLSPQVIAHFETPFEAFIVPFESRPELGITERPAFER
ncbi:mycothiol S-conjugate amidase [Abditibacteriota bacterium]|nr:mycothiol S-conjugate amidase [Abditibacteriota bacterium]